MRLASTYIIHVIPAVSDYPISGASILRCHLSLNPLQSDFDFDVDAGANPAT
jgi:hypothetical protein